MARVHWGVLLWACVCLPLAAEEGRPRRVGVTYVLQRSPPKRALPAGPAGRSRTSRAGSASLQLRLGPGVGPDGRASPRGRPQPPLQGVNVCGGRCCQGWSQAPGSQRCTKPNCAPPCQNGGMCLRPQLCVCKPGTKGNSCEKTVMQDTSSVGGRGPVGPPWPIPQQSAQQTFSKKVVLPQKVSPMAQMAFTLKQKPPVGLPQQMKPRQNNRGRRWEQKKKTPIVIPHDS